MAPAVILDNTPDLDLPTSHPTKAPFSSAAPRTLLLAPPSVAANPHILTSVAEAYDRNATDIQMLDRLVLGLVALPPATYDVILLLSDVAAGRQEDARSLDRQAMQKLVDSLKVGGKLRAQSGGLGNADRSEAILAGLVEGETGMAKEAVGAAQTVKLSFGKKKANAAAVPANGVEAGAVAKRKNEEPTVQQPAASVVQAAPNGVGFVDTTDDFGGDYDDEDDMEFEIPSNEELERAGRIDPDALLTEEDRQRPIIVPEECKPNTKRRRACKDCSCGLAQKLEAEDRALRAKADKNLALLQEDDLAEVDFTVQGKVGSCGNCALGDAFRCDGCPYIGLPAFKPGEEVRLLNNDVQL